jgi:hypothetical protein
MTGDTMSELAAAQEVEAVALALAVADGKDPDAPARVRYPGGYPEGICWRDQYCVKARAAIAALRARSQVKAGE